MDIRIAEKFKEVGYDAVVRDGPELAVAVISDFVDLYREEMSSFLIGDKGDELREEVEENVRMLELLREAVSPDALLSSGQQRLLKHQLHFSSEAAEGLETYRDVMEVVMWIHECSRLNGV